MLLIDRCQNSREDRVVRLEIISTILRGARRREPYGKRESDRLIDADLIRLEDIYRRRIKAENDSKSSDLTGVNVKTDTTDSGVESYHPNRWRGRKNSTDYVESTISSSFHMIHPIPGPPNRYRFDGFRRFYGQNP